MHFIAPSILAADFARLGEEISIINDSQADWLHVDVMDGRFVPNISFGQAIVESIKKHCTKPLDVHLMIVEPEKYIEEFRQAGADVITVHYEACTHLHRTLQQIRATGAKAGIALNPHTPISVLEDIIDEADLVCLMSVNPGFGGQKFITQTYEKVKKLRKLISDNHSATLIEIDGGVGLANYKQLIHAGADILVAGNSVFKAENPKQAIVDLKKLV